MTRNALKRLQIEEKTGTGLQEIKEKPTTILAEHGRAITATGSI